MISIHALVKRATVMTFTKSDKLSISIHALVKRATLPSVNAVLSVDISIHALVKRATIALTAYLPLGTLTFQSTPS